MKNGIYIGLAIGMITGALLACNNGKVRTVVSDAQQKIKDKIKKHGADAMQSTCECACETFCCDGSETMQDESESMQ